MLRLGMFTCSLFCLSLIGCGGGGENSMPEGMTPQTAEEVQAMDDYDAAQELDPATGQPKGQ